MPASPGTGGRYEWFYWKVWRWVDSFLDTYIPATLLVVLNALIVYKIVASRRAMRTRQLNESNSSVAPTVIILFVESVVFLVISVPGELVFNTELAILERYPRDLSVSRCVVHVMRRVFLVVRSAGGALNFVLYMLTGRRFRRAFVDTICRRGSLAPALR